MFAPHWPSIRFGVGVALAGAIPFVLAAQIVTAIGDVDLTEQEEVSGALLLTIALGLAAFVAIGAGAFSAARRQSDTPLSHALVTALIAYAAIQLIGVIRLSATNGDIVVSRIFVNSVLASSAGLVGGLVADRRNRHDSVKRLSDPEPPTYGRDLQ